MALVPTSASALIDPQALHLSQGQVRRKDAGDTLPVKGGSSGKVGKLGIGISSVC